MSPSLHLLIFIVSTQFIFSVPSANELWVPMGGTVPSADLSHVCAVAPEPWYCWSYSTCSSHWNPIGILLPLAFYLSKNTTRDRTKEWYRERNCWSSWLPSSQGLGYPWAVFWSSLSCCSSVYSLMKNPITVVLHSALFLSLSYFCFTVPSMPSLLNPSNAHNHISSTCLYLENCRWFFSALCWYVAFCCCRVAPVVLTTFGLRS